MTKNGNQTVHVEDVSHFRLLAPRDNPNYLIIRIETRAGETFNFGLDREHFTKVVQVWNLDLSAVQAAIAAGQPIPTTATQQSLETYDASPVVICPIFVHPKKRQPFSRSQSRP